MERSHFIWYVSTLPLTALCLYLLYFTRSFTGTWNFAVFGDFVTQRLSSTRRSTKSSMNSIVGLGLQHKHINYRTFGSIHTTRVHGPCSWAVNTGRKHGPWTWVLFWTPMWIGAGNNLLRIQTFQASWRYK